MERLDTSVLLCLADVLPRSSLKNLAMAGGLLQVAAFGAGRFSLDARQGRA